MLGKKNVINIKGYQPLDSRPKLIVGVLEDGRRAVFGDSCPLTTEEYLKVVGGYAEPTTPRLKFTDSEQVEIDAAEDCLARVSELVDKLYDDGRRLSEEVRAACPPPAFGDTPLSEEQAEVIQNIEARIHDLQGRIGKASKLESHALRKRNTIRQRITIATRERQFPIQYHNPNKTLDDQLADPESNDG